MTQQFEFIAPDGARIQGTEEMTPGTCGVYFTGPDPATDFDFDDQGTREFDGGDSKEVADTVIFVDENGEGWLAHHLIPGDAEVLTTGTLDLFRREFLLGEAFDTAKLFAVAVEALGTGSAEIFARQAYEARDWLETSYANAKAASLAAKDRELKEQEEASPRVRCADCQWEGDERDCNEIKDFSERVSPGEICPAGECPECGALCHLLEKEGA